MRNGVKLLSLVFTLIVTAYAQKPTLLSRLHARSTSVETKEGHGTGIIVARGFVLTNFHLLHSGYAVTVNKKVARIVKVDPLHDLALLATGTGNISPVTIAKTAAQDERIIVIGNPLDHKGMVVRGRITTIDDDGTIYIDAHVFFGNSGGGMYNLKGQLLGVVRGIEGEEGDGFPYGVVIPSSVVRKFLEEHQVKNISRSEIK